MEICETEIDIIDVIIVFPFNSFLQYIFAELGVNEGDEQLASPSKEQLDQEKQLLLFFKPVLQKFLHDHSDLQVSALYSLQVHCNANAFPKGTETTLSLSCCACWDFLNQLNPDFFFFFLLEDWGSVFFFFVI